MEPNNASFSDYPDYNDSRYPDFNESRPYSASNIISLVVYFMVFLVGVPGNAIVVWVTGSKAHKTVNAVWFLSLAVADLMCCLVLPLLSVSILQHDKWPFGSAACRLLPSVILFSMYSSILLLTVISIDRCMFVMYPIWCQNNRTVPVAWGASILAWLLALVLTTPSLIYRKLFEDYNHCECVLLYTNKTVEISVGVFRFLLTFLVPLFIISTCYTLLLQRLWRRQATRSQKTLKVVLAVVMGFFVCWTPYQIVGFLMAVNHKNASIFTWLTTIDHLTIALAYVNSCINPIIYMVAGYRIKNCMMRLSICKVLSDVLSEDSGEHKSKSFTQSTVTSSHEEQV